MTRKEKKEYLQTYVQGQGTQVGLSIAPLLEAIIDGNDDIFVVTVEDNTDNTKGVTNRQEDIDNFIAASNEDPVHNTPKVFIDGAVLAFTQIEVSEDEINGLIFVDGGKYILTLSTAEGSSRLVYTADEP